MTARSAGRAGYPRLISRTVPLEDPAVFHSTIREAEMVWLSPGTKLAASGAALRCRVQRTPGRLTEASARLRSIFAQSDIHDPVDMPGTGPVAFGVFSFDPTDGGSHLQVPSVVYGVSETAAWKTEIRPEQEWDYIHGPFEGKDDGLQGRKTDADPFSDWLNKFELVSERLRSGELQKLVLARKVEVHSESAFHRHDVLSALAGEFPDCYTFAFGNFIGASPELLVRRLGPVVDSMPIAGSAPRGSDEIEDTNIGLRLLASAKDQTEHRLTKEAVVAGLSPFCSSIEAEAEPSLLLLSNVQHLSTKVQGRLQDSPDCLELVGALHPTPAVCGVPPDKALKAIRSIEDSTRGRYAGPVGWMDHRGDGEWAIALRCAELNGSSATLFAGAGIVAGSDPHSEFQETELKLRAMKSALVQGRSFDGLT